MPEDTSKLLGLIEDLATIAEDAPKTEGLIFVTLSPDSPVEVHVGNKSLEKLKKYYPGKVIVEDHSDEYVQESMVFFDEVKVYALIAKPQPELDINVVESAEAAV